MNAPEANPLLNTARRYAAAGLSIVPVRADGTKAPVGKWKPYQKRQATDAELGAWWGNGNQYGFALVHGAISGNTEVLDFDAPGAFEEWQALCADHGLSDLAERCLEVQTPSGGRHLYYRHQGEPEGNQKLANRPLYDAPEGPTPGELKEAGYRQDGRGVWYRVETKIETRGEGGYTIAPGSPRECHPSGREYRKIRGHFGTLPVLTAEERTALLAMARACNQYAEATQYHAPQTEKRQPRGGFPTPGARPGDDYNSRVSEADVLALLLRHGWQEAGHRGDIIDLTRPGKNTREGTSGTLNAVGPGVFFCFTSSASPFEPERAYPPFSVFALLEHGGDFAEAARLLGKGGYGDQTPPEVRRAAKTQATFSDKPSPGTNTPNPSDPLSAVPHFQLTDVGNGRRLVHRHGQDLRYVYEWNKWYCWDSKRWNPDAGDGIETRAKETAEALLRDSVKLPHESDRAALVKHALKMQDAKNLRAMIWAARSDVKASPREWDNDRWLLNCQNGTLDLRTGELRKHDRADKMTKIVSVAYDPKAIAPIWEKFLEQILPDPEVRAFLQRAVGYALTGDVSEQCLFFFYGSGSNGKSTFLGALMDLLADYAMQAAPDLLIAKENSGGGPNNDIAELQGKRLVATIEVEDGKRMAEGLVKQITGGDRIKARFMRQDYFEFEPSHKIFLAANHQPTIRGQDFAIWRRIKVVPFTVQIAEEDKDKHLPDKLRQELPGILAWAVRGCVEWFKSGLGDPEAVKTATSAYREGMDVLRDFIEECCIIRPSQTVTAATLYKVYCSWSAENGGGYSLGRKNFGQRLREQGGIQPATGIGPKAARGWVGIGLRSDRIPPEGEGEDESENDTPDVSDVSDVKSPINKKTNPIEMNRGKASETSETSGKAGYVRTILTNSGTTLYVWGEGDLRPVPPPGMTGAIPSEPTTPEEMMAAITHYGPLGPDEESEEF